MIIICFSQRSIDDELIIADSISEPKVLMLDCADAFIRLPGGLGRFEEIFEVMKLKQLGRYNKPTILAKA